MLVLSLVSGIVKFGATWKVGCVFREQVALLFPPRIFMVPVGPSFLLSSAPLSVLMLPRAEV